MPEETNNPSKNCPFMMIALAAKANDKAFLYHAKCMGDQCELWDEYAGRCGLVSGQVRASYGEGQVEKQAFESYSDKFPRG